MERSIKTVIVLVFLTACVEKAPPIPKLEISEKNQALIGEWRYSHIIVEGDVYELATSQMTPSSAKAQAGGERAVLSRRSISFYADNTYELKWNRSEYQLGTPETPNYQPGFGSWQIESEGDSLIQNMGLPYETRYKLSINNGRLTRVSERYISETLPNSGNWTQGDTVVYTEVFLKKL